MDHILLVHVVLKITPEGQQHTMKLTGGPGGPGGPCNPGGPRVP